MGEGEASVHKCSGMGDIKKVVHKALCKPHPGAGEACRRR